MALQLLEFGDCALGYDSSTNERGFLIKIKNGTGATSVKGNLVSTSTTENNAVVLQANEYDTIGAVAESGVAANSDMWIWINGSVCEVLFKDTESATAGNILLAADTDGRGYDVANPGAGLPAVDTHFKECGHVLESVTSGTDILALCSLHFN